MDALKNFRKYILVESKESVSLTKINEMSELPTFNNFEKQILQYGLDNIENIKEGDYASEVADEMFNPVGDGLIIYNSEGVDLLSNFNTADSGYGWASALEYVFSAAEEVESLDYIAEKMVEGNWAAIANSLIMEMGRELILASEVLAPLIANDERLDAEDIQDLEQELELFIS